MDALAGVEAEERVLPPTDGLLPGREQQGPGLPVRDQRLCTTRYTVVLTLAEHRHQESAGGFVRSVN